MSKTLSFSNVFTRYKIERPIILRYYKVARRKIRTGFSYSRKKVTIAWERIVLLLTPSKFRMLFYTFP